MARRKLTVEEMIRRLQDIPSDESEEELSNEEDDGEEEDGPIPEAVSAANSDSEESTTQSSGEESSESEDHGIKRNTLTSRAGIEWRSITGQVGGAGRAPALNVFRRRAGPTPFADRHCSIPLSCFKLFVDQPMLRTIQRYTEIQAKKSEPDFNVSVEDIEKFIGLQLARGILTAKNTAPLFSWDKEWGHSFYKTTMARNRFIAIMKHIRFDEKSRRDRLRMDKFCHVSEIGTLL